MVEEIRKEHEQAEAYDRANKEARPEELLLTDEEIGIDELAKALEEPRAIRLLAEWLAIDHDETRLQFEKYLESAQGLYDYVIVVMGYGNTASILRPNFGKKLIEWVAAYKDASGRNALAETPEESADYLFSLIGKENDGHSGSTGYKARPDESKKERHEWHWHRPSYGLRECSKCGKISTIRSHSTLGGCKPLVESRPVREEIADEITLPSTMEDMRHWQLRIADQIIEMGEK